jgi:hypothetical protein
VKILENRVITPEILGTKTSILDIKNDALCRWLTYFDENTPENKLTEVIKMDTAIQKANERLNFVTRDKDFLRNYHRRIMEESDRITEINTAMERGGNAKSFDIAKKCPVGRFIKDHHFQPCSIRA